MVEIVDELISSGKDNGQTLVSLFVPLVIGTVAIFAVKKYILKK